MSKKISFFNSQILNEIYNDDNFRLELIDYLNEAIEDEIDKEDDMDTSLVSNLVDVVMLLEEGNMDEALIKLSKSTNIIEFVNKNEKSDKIIRVNFKRTLVAAIAVVMLTTGVMYQTAFAFTDAVDSVFCEVYKSVIESANETKDEDIDVNVSLGPVIIPNEDEKGVPVKNINEAKEILSKVDYCAIIDEDGNTEPIRFKDIDVSYTKIGKTRIVAVLNYKGSIKTETFYLEE